MKRSLVSFTQALKNFETVAYGSLGGGAFTAGQIPARRWPARLGEGGRNVEGLTTVLGVPDSRPEVEQRGGLDGDGGGAAARFRLRQA